MLLLSSSYIFCKNIIMFGCRNNMTSIMSHKLVFYYLFMFLLFRFFFKYRLISEENYELLSLESRVSQR